MPWIKGVGTGGGGGGAPPVTHACQKAGIWGGGGSILVVGGYYERAIACYSTYCEPFGQGAPGGSVFFANYLGYFSGVIMFFKS